jgi:glucose-6-phosphate-specific signal transduction histidine kinase
MSTHCKKHSSLLLLGIAVTAMAMPFGLTAAALATTLISVILAAWRHDSGNAPDPQDMALILAGGALYLLWSRALLPGMGLGT